MRWRVCVGCGEDTMCLREETFLFSLGLASHFSVGFVLSVKRVRLIFSSCPN